MELRHLRMFLALAEELHFGRTAARLRVAQSAVSQTVAALEDEVGARLFSRAPRDIRLTPAGTELLVHARRALALLAEGTASARRAASGETGQLALSFGPLTALTRIPKVVARFRRAFPGVTLRLDAAGPGEQLAALRDGSLDLAFVPLSKYDLGTLAMEVVEQARVVAVLPRDHRLARRTHLTFRELSGETLLILGQMNDPRMRALVDERCRKEHFEPEAVIEVAALETLLALVTAGAGISFVPDLVERVGFAGVKLVPMRPRVPAPIAAVWDAERLPATAAHFLAMLRRS